MKPSRRAQIVYRFEDFELHSGDGLLLKRRRRVAAEPKVVEVIVHLVENADRIVSKRELLDTLWPNVSVVDGVVHRCISRARRILGDESRRRRLIATHGRRGYQFIGQVQSERVGSKHEAGTTDSAARIRAPHTLIGRTRELHRLEGMLDELAAGGRGAALAVCGEAGIGKSRVLAELAREARHRGIRVIESQCSEIPGAPAFLAWTQVLREIVASDAGARLVREMGPRLADVAQVVPEIATIAPAASKPPLLAPDQQRLRFFDSAEQLVCRFAKAGPTLIVLDDLHGADDGSLLFWHLLSHAAERVPLMLAGGYRTCEIRRRKMLAKIDADLFRDGRRARLELGPLSQPDVHVLVSEVLDAAASARLASKIHDRAQGNPFFALELAAHVRDLVGCQGLDATETALDQGRIALSAGIRSILRLRVAAASAPCREVLAWAAMIGARFDLKLLRAVCERPQAEVDAGLDEAHVAELVDASVDERGSLRFRHGLIRDVIYDELAPAMRMNRHRRITEEIANDRERPLEERYDELAHHSLSALPDGCVNDAVAYAVKAAEGATSRLAFEQAAVCYERALAALRAYGAARERRICELVLEIADSRNRAGDDVRARAAYEEAAALARNIAAGDLLARAAIGYSVRFGQPIDFGVPAPDALALLEEALAGLDEQDDTRRAILLACLSCASYGVREPEHVLALATRSEALARRIGNAYATSVALFAKHMASLQPGRLEGVAGIADELISVSEASGMDEMVLVGHTFRVFRAFEDAADARALDEAIDVRSRLASSLRQPQGLWWSHVIGSCRSMMTGDWQRAAELSRSAHDLAARSTNTNQDMAFRSQEAQVLMHRGEMGALLELTRESHDRYPQMQAAEAAYFALRAALGERHAARAFARRWHGRNLADALQASNWLFEAACLAELAFYLDDGELALPLYELLRPHRDKNVMVGQAIAYVGPVALYMGLLACVLARLEDAQPDFEHALERAGALAAAPWVARTQIAFARFLRRPGTCEQRERAASLLRDAADIAHRTGAIVLHGEIAMLEAGAA